MAVTADCFLACHNIPQEDGINCLKEALDERVYQTMQSNFLVKLIDLVQKIYIFKFHDQQLWKQLIGVAMGIHPAPSFANIYLENRQRNNQTGIQI